LQSTLNRVPETRLEAKRITVREFVEEFITLRTGPRGQRLKASTLALHSHALSRFADAVGRDTPLRSLTPMDATRFFADLRDGGTGAGTINRLKCTLKAAFSAAVQPFGYLSRNPFSGIRQDRITNTEIRYVTSREFSALLNPCDVFSPDRAIWFRAILLVGYTVGLRFNEAVHLAWSDVDFGTDMIRVTSKADGPSTIQWEPKDYETRCIPAPPQTMALLAELHESTPSRHAYVFLTAERLALIKAAMSCGLWREGQQTVNNFPREFIRIILRAAGEVESLATWKRTKNGLLTPDKPTISYHDLRRSAITNWSKSANIQTVSRLAGHSDISTTQRYYLSATQDQIELARQASEASMSDANVKTDDGVTKSAPNRPVRPDPPGIST